MSLHLSKEQAGKFLQLYHFRPATIEAVFKRLGTIQYDPLNPVGRNVDLVLQARVPGYSLDDWQHHVYEQRRAYDAWDKQACLVPVDQWSKRSIIRASYLAWHDREVLAEYPEALATTLAELDARGPLSSLEFEDRSAVGDGHAWYGPSRVKRILRALWLRGVVVTHHRHAGRHYYDRAERVIPLEYLDAAIPSMAEYHRWIMLQRHRATGLLRQSAEAAVWSACGDSGIRREAIRDLVETGDITPVRIEGSQHQYHILSEALNLLDEPEIGARAIFIAPLDSMLWDRKAVEQIFDFNYIWEVYKREADRLWGYYVLPVFYSGRFVGRFDSRLVGGIWHISKWWWESDVRLDAQLLESVGTAAQKFAEYLGAQGARVGERVDASMRDVLQLHLG